MASLESKLKILQKKSIQKGHWPVVASVANLQLATESVDTKINLVGAMHEVGLLSNSLAPYWAAWRSTTNEADAWASRCIDRLHVTDSDYWAAAGLLNLPLTSIKNALASRGYELLAIRFAESFKEGRWHIATFCGAHNDAVISPVVEIGWSKANLINEVTRWRAVVLKEQSMSSGSLVGRGFGSYYIRAKLPYGCWRIHEDSFELKQDWIVPKSQTPMADYP